MHVALGASGDRRRDGLTSSATEFFRVSVAFKSYGTGGKPAFSFLKVNVIGNVIVNISVISRLFRKL